MAKPVKLLSSARRGMRRDTPRHQMPKESVWNLVDLIPEVIGAPLEKRGGWSYGSDAFTGVHAGSDECVAVFYADFTAAPKLCVASRDVGVATNLLTVNTSTNAVSSVGNLSNTMVQNPVLHADKLIFPFSGGATAPQKYDGSTLAALGGSPPNGTYATVYKDRTVLARTSTNKTRVYFSDPADPEGWDTTNTYLSVLSPITGLAALPNALLVFQDKVTSRIRGSTPPPGTDMIVDDPLFSVGCSDARSIVTRGAFCVFANPLGVYISNGTLNPEDLTASAGLKSYWLEIMAAYSSSTYTLAAGMIRDYYIISVMNGSSFVDCLMFDVPKRTGWRLSNIGALCFGSAVTGGEELYFGLKSVGRLGKLSSIFSPASGVKNDADGTAVGWTLETPFYIDRPGKKTWRSAYVSYDMQDAASDNPVLTVSYQKTPEGSYTALSPTLAESTDYTRARLPLRVPAHGIGLKIVQSNASSVSRLYDLEAEVHTRELSRLN